MVIDCSCCSTELHYPVCNTATRTSTRRPPPHPPPPLDSVKFSAGAVLVLLLRISRSISTAAAADCQRTLISISIFHFIHPPPTSHHSSRQIDPFAHLFLKYICYTRSVHHVQQQQRFFGLQLNTPTQRIADRPNRGEEEQEEAAAEVGEYNKTADDSRYATKHDSSLCRHIRTISLSAPFRPSPCQRDAMIWVVVVAVNIISLGG